MNNKQVILRKITRDEDSIEELEENIVNLPKELPYFITTKYDHCSEKDKLHLPVLLKIIKNNGKLIPVIDKLTDNNIINYLKEHNINFISDNEGISDNILLTYAFLSDKLTLYEICNTYEL